ncbi:MAG: FAD-dependent oxidoreductase [Bacillota bacterium]
MFPERGAGQLIFDVLVIGGGMAGLAAAADLSRRGRRVLVVRKGYGATALSSGAIDFSCGIPAPPEAESAALLSMLSGAGLPVEIKKEGGFTLCDQTGRVRTAACAQFTMARADLGGLAGKRVTLVGILGYGGFNTGFLSRVLSERCGAASIEKIEADLPGGHGKQEITGPEAAHLLQHPGSAALLAKNISERTGAAGGDLLVFPPVLGISGMPQIVADLEARTGRQVAELPAAVPSLPGLRLQEAMERACRQPGVQIQKGEVIGLEGDNGTLLGARAAGGGRIYTLSCKAVIMAGGKFIGGGLKSVNRTLLEPLLNLPLYLGSERVDGIPLQRLLRDGVAGPQPAFAAGIAVDQSMRPLDITGRPARVNLFAAGSIIGSLPGARGLPGLGDAFLSGIRAAAAVDRYLAGGDHS